MRQYIKQDTNKGGGRDVVVETILEVLGFMK